MSDFYEIDFLGVASPKSGDAITIRYRSGGDVYIHVVDGGFQLTGEKVVAHINEHYGAPKCIDHVVVTHPDQDHCGGLSDVLEEFEVGMLWMLRPWEYTSDLISRFTRFTNEANLAKRLKEVYSNIAALEEIAAKKGIPIAAPFQGQTIGAFTVLSPSYADYLDLIEASEKTPEAVVKAEEDSLLEKGFRALVKFISAVWGQEVFSTKETSAENEMSVIQWANLEGHDVVLTGDAGRKALNAAADFAPSVGLMLPGVKKIQVPHHGSRRNVDANTLDRWLGNRLPLMPAEDELDMTAYVSASKEDEHHPKNSVVRAFIHRGARVFTTKGVEWLHTHKNAPERAGSSPAAPMNYPDTMEEG